MSNSSYAVKLGDDGDMFVCFRDGDKYALRIVEGPSSRGVVMSEEVVRKLVACMHAYLGELSDEKAAAAKAKETK